MNNGKRRIPKAFRYQAKIFGVSSKVFRRTATLVLPSILVVLLFPLGELSATNTERVGLGASLQELRAASSVVLMIVPYPTFFVMKLNEVQLGRTSCHYEIQQGPVLDELVDILGRAVIEYRRGPKPSPDLRLALLFRANGKLAREFYFNDSGGSFDLLGFSGDRAIAAVASLPDQLRALVLKPGVLLTQDPRSACPRHP